MLNCKLKVQSNFSKFFLTASFMKTIVVLKTVFYMYHILLNSCAIHSNLFLLFTQKRVLILHGKVFCDYGSTYCEYLISVIFFLCKRFHINPIFYSTLSAFYSPHNTSWQEADNKTGQSNNAHDLVIIFSHVLHQYVHHM